MKLFISIALISLTTTAAIAGTKYKEGMVEAASYLDRMSAHNQQGIVLAKMGTDRAVTPEVKEAAERILQDERKDFAQLRIWRKEKYEIIPEEKGLETKVDLKSLSESKEGEFDTVFLDKMISHQQEGIALSKIAIPSLKDTAIKEFTQKNAEENTKEVTDLQLIQGSLNSRKF